MAARPARRIHRESLLRIPLLAQALADPAFRVVVRGIDARWAYVEAIERNVAGFNPMRGAAFIGRHSRFERWLRAPAASARTLNESDTLMSEALYVVHDYLHAWAYQWIDRLHPALGFGCAPITSRNFEAMVFCHLVSEAIATVGLDYWYLSATDLDRVVPIGTRERGLTVSFRESAIAEYRRFNPALTVQHPGFFGSIARFYCDGTFVGFAARDLRNSPALDAWIRHELRYGQLQRRYCRQWFAYLSRHAPALTATQLDAPVACDASWQRRLIARLGEMLWAKVKSDEALSAGRPLDGTAVWTAPVARTPDFRFVNLNRCKTPRQPLAEMPDDSFEFLLRQYVSRFDYQAFPAEAMGVFRLIAEARDFKIGERLLRDFKRIPTAPAEPRDLFFYN